MRQQDNNRKENGFAGAGQRPPHPSSVIFQSVFLFVSLLNTTGSIRQQLQVIQVAKVVQLLQDGTYPYIIRKSAMAFSLVSSQKHVNCVGFQHLTSSGTPRGTPDEFKARNQIPAGVLSQSLSGQFKKNACISD